MLFLKKKLKTVIFKYKIIFILIYFFWGVFIEKNIKNKKIQLYLDKKFLKLIINIIIFQVKIY